MKISLVQIINKSGHVNFFNFNWEFCQLEIGKILGNFRLGLQGLNFDPKSGQKKTASVEFSGLDT